MAWCGARSSCHGAAPRRITSSKCLVAGTMMGLLAQHFNSLVDLVDLVGCSVHEVHLCMGRCVGSTWVLIWSSFCFGLVIFVKLWGIGGVMWLGKRWRSTGDVLVVPKSSQVLICLVCWPQTGAMYDGWWWMMMDDDGWWMDDGCAPVVIIRPVWAARSDIRPPLIPPWWCILPPPVRVLRGLYWQRPDTPSTWLNQKMLW